MKLIKKITAAVTAMAMAVGMMSIVASAEKYTDRGVSTYQNYSLYYYTGTPYGTVSNITQTIGADPINPVYYIKKHDYLKTTDRKVSMSANYITVTSYVYTIGSGWIYVDSFTHSKTEDTEKTNGEIYNAYAVKNNPAKVVLTMYGYSYNGDALGQVIAE